MTTHPKTLEEALEMFDEKYGQLRGKVVRLEGGLVMNPVLQSIFFEEVKSFLELVWHAGRESVVIDLNPDEIAEKIVIGYANESGREESARPIIRKVAISTLSDVITKLSELKK